MGNFSKAGLISTALAISLIILMICSCDDNPLDEDESLNTIFLTISSGNNQTERVNAPLASPLTVSLLDILGNPKSGVTVNFSTSAPGAVIMPPSVSSDASGLASCLFRLGNTTGQQHVKAAAEGDSVIFTATAVEAGCAEEDIEGSCNWPAGHIFISTTSSSMLSGSGSVIIDFDPGTGTPVKVLETTEWLTDISFSSRGELFAAANGKIFKVNSVTKDLGEFAAFPAEAPIELEPNAGGIVAAIDNAGIYKIGCSPAAPYLEFPYN